MKLHRCEINMLLNLFGSRKILSCQQDRRLILQQQAHLFLMFKIKLKFNFAVLLKKIVWYVNKYRPAD